MIVHPLTWRFPLQMVHQLMYSSVTFQIQEEVGYSADNIKLVRTGRPLLVDDGRLHFRVHPFLFDFVDQAAESAKPQLNWENVESRFIDPDVISQLQTVPKLICTLERVIMSEEQEAAVGRIIEDRDSGAAELALLAVSSLEEEANRLLERPRKVMDGEMALENFRNFAYHLGNCRPAMAPLANAVALVLSKMNDNLANRFGEAFRSVADSSIISKSLLCAASSVKEVLVKSKTSVVQNAISLIGNRTTIVTISKSSTLLETFLEALKRHMDYNLIVCESRPLCEGVTVATRCAEAGLRNITLITDAQMAHFMHYADVIMVGGDAVTDSGVYNKVGTYLMALAANHTGKPVYIILDSLKLSPGSLYSVLHDDQDDTCNPSEENDGDELRQAWVGMPFSPAIQVRNFYFEKTPLDLITKMVNEHGVLDPVDIPNQIREMKNMYLAAFDPSL